MMRTPHVNVGSVGHIDQDDPDYKDFVKHMIHGGEADDPEEPAQGESETDSDTYHSCVIIKEELIHEISERLSVCFAPLCQI